ncbi:NOP58 [Sanghuangporus sanghuang]
MLVLYETSLGYCLFKLTDSAKLKSADLWEEFESPERASGLLKLKAIHRFESAASAVDEISSIQEGKLGKGLKKFLSDEILEKGKLKETLTVIDSKLGASISKKLGIKVMADSSTTDLYRGIRGQLAALLGELDPRDLAQMSLGLSHSLSRFKLKFSPDKVDTMVIQSIALLDDLDKEINIYSMRVKEWYGWHFPEMSKILTDSVAYAKVVRAMGFRTNAASTSLAHILPEELEQTIKLAAEISMGTEISESDMANINGACDQVIAISAYRAQLAEYLRNRMQAIAPNLTALVGELVGARLISHAGSLLNLAKFPASTVQILGAEKALFRALKTKHDTPKYGLIYHASLVGQAPPKLKGKLARMVAAKAALSIRYDALTDADGKSEESSASIGLENRTKLESRLRALEHQNDLNGVRSFSSPGKKQAKYEATGETRTYNPSGDVVGLVSTQREPVQAAMKAVADVKAEKKRAKEERRAKRRAEKEGKEIAEKAKAELAADGDAMDMDGKSKEEKREKKKKEKEKSPEKSPEKVTNGAMDVDARDSEPEKKREAEKSKSEETEDERKARKKAKKEAKAAAKAQQQQQQEQQDQANGERPKKRKRKSEVLTDE